jgi:hypothetical protein
MKLPENVLALIKEYAKPITRGDWRKGSSCNDAFKYSIFMDQLYKMYLKYYLCSNDFIKNKFKSILEVNTLSDSIKIYGEMLYSLSPYRPYMIYNNFYFILRYFSCLKYTITSNVCIIDEIIAHNYY